MTFNDKWDNFGKGARRRMVEQGMDTVVRFFLDWRGHCEPQDMQSLLPALGDSGTNALLECLERTARLVRNFSRDLYHDLVGASLCLRIADVPGITVQLRPHDLLLNRRLLDRAAANPKEGRDLLVAVLEAGLFHARHPTHHVSQVRLHSLQFLHAHQSILEATIRELDQGDYGQGATPCLAELREAETLLLLQRFWEWIAASGTVGRIWKACHQGTRGHKTRVKGLLERRIPDFCTEAQVAQDPGVYRLCRVGHLLVEDDAVVIGYRLGKQVLKVIRVCRRDKVDAMAAPSACVSIPRGALRTDLFHDHGPFIRPWVDRLETYAKHGSLSSLAGMLTSDNLHIVHGAVDELVARIRRKQTPQESVRLLYAALYYWQNAHKGLCRSVCLRVSKILEDLLTERPVSFPPSQLNRSIFRGEPFTLRVAVKKPFRIAARNVLARVLWAVNGHRKRPVAMVLDASASTPSERVFRAPLPRRSGWIHYAVQVSFDGGATWAFERFNPQSHGLLKSMPDERGQRVLSFYADTIHLRLDERLNPMRDASGAYVYGAFDEIADILSDIRDEGYTRIYPLGALELGWAGEAGPDPSVFSIWDGRAVRRDMGGLDGLLRLRDKAHALGMKVLLCVVSHFSRANVDHAPHLPVYIPDAAGRLTRRAGWDGQWDEWRDSFMVNMRDLDNVEHLVGICQELTRLGFGLRFDVGHGFDTVFPVHDHLEGTTRLFGEVTHPGFEPIDLRGTDEPNIAMLYICYRVQKACPGALLAYAEQWHGNEARMLKSGAIPYNAIIKNLENIRSGQGVDSPMGLNDNLAYLARVREQCGGQMLSLFNSHDEEAPASNYQNMIWPAAAFLVFSSYGPLMYHISRLPDARSGSVRKRFDLAYTECWKHWVNNRFNHPWALERQSQEDILSAYPLLRGFGAYLRGLYHCADVHPALTKGTVVPIPTHNSRIAAFLRCYREECLLCVFNFPDPHPQGQTAVAREFNFALPLPEAASPLGPLEPDVIYELRERYNNVEGRMRAHRKEYWSGEELGRLGFGGVLPPVSTRVYEIIHRDHAIHEKDILPDSLLRYFRYGKEDRIRHSYVAKAFRQACDRKTRGFRRFGELMTLVVTWIHRSRKWGIGELSILLAEISEADPQRRQQVISFLMRIAVNEAGHFPMEVVQAAVDVLQSLNVGTIALISPESKFSGSAGGVGIYTTDIADVLSELGFHVVLVTPLYECDRQMILSNYTPRYDGHSVSLYLPRFDEASQTTDLDPSPQVVNLLRARLARYKHGKRSRLDVLYLENAAYLDRPYGGTTADDKLRRARVLSEGALEALRCYNYYPTVIQTNEWPTWLVPAYLAHWPKFRADPHFAKTQIISMIHNPHPAYNIVVNEANPNRRHYYCQVLGLDPYAQGDVLFNPDRAGGIEIDLLYTMLKTSVYVGTVSRAMRQRILDEPWLFGHSREYTEKARAGRFFGRRNGFNMAARQRFWFGTRRSILETYDSRVRRRLFKRCLELKQNAKLALQRDSRIRLRPDDESAHHVIFAMLHRICPQKGFELLVDWKVYTVDGGRQVRFEPWNMDQTTVLEYFLSTDPRIQYVICGRVEDSMDGRRFDMHLRRIAGRPEFQGRFAYYPEGHLSSSLYRNLYVGSQYFVMPSGGAIGEPCGISQQEAHAGGTPVIAHHQDGLIRTVCDRDFGDTAYPSNGIKFGGFTGESLLSALMDAVEIYFHDRRLRYRDDNGQPRRLAYRELCFNAFRTDHRWLRLLRDYIAMYAEVLGVRLPEHLDAMHLVSGMLCIEDRHWGDVVLRKGMDMPWALDRLVEALACPTRSVRQRVADVLVRLHAVPEVRRRVDIPRRLAKGAESTNPIMRQAARRCLDRLAAAKTRRHAGDDSA